MFKNYWRWYLGLYGDASLEIKQKAKTLVVVNHFIIAAVTLDLIINLFSHSSMLSNLLELLLPLSVGITLWLLKAGKIHLSVNVSIVALTLALFANGLNGLAIDLSHTMTLFRVLVFLIPIYLYTCLVATRPYQAWMATVLITGLFTFFAVWFVWLNGKKPPETLNISMFITTALFVVIPGIWTYFVIRNSQEVIRVAESESDKNRLRSQRMQEVLKNMKKGLEIGGELKSLSARILDLAAPVTSSLNEIKAASGSLHAKMVDVAAKNRTLVDTSRKAKSAIEGQGASVNQTTSAVGEIDQSMRRISELTKSRMDMLSKLSDTTKEGEEIMGQARDASKRLAQAIQEVLQMARVIQDVASQTGILAMNASIEAAHAGERGKGFAIVAGEVRKLSHTTDQNSKEITNSIQKNSQSIEQSGRLNDAAAETFVRIADKVREVRLAIQEVQNGVEEMAKGTSSIRQEMSEILNGSRTVRDTMEQVDATVREGDLALAGVVEFADRLAGDSKLILQSFEEVVKAAREVDLIGKANVSGMETLEAEIRSASDE